ncbi:MAG: GNAT family N-acetyltransferase [Polyangiaceae bacterium]|nr:GNAT family N-acetyltransferase [Polyangiaceae bacterium]
MRAGTSGPGMRAEGGASCRVVVCRRAGGRALGWVYIRPSGEDAVYIHDLQVLPRYRGSGLGAQLMAAALRIGAGWGRTRAWLEAADDGSGRLVRWYERLGFERAGPGAHGMPLMRAYLRGAPAPTNRW